MKVPYMKLKSTAQDPEYCGTREILQEAGRPLPKAKYSQRPIVNKYREGKVKSTPVRGVK